MSKIFTSQEEFDKEDEQAFQEALDEFFEICFEKAKKGEMPYEQIERFINTAKKVETGLLPGLSVNAN